MKCIKILTAIFFILWINVLVSQPTWVWQNPLPTGEDLNSVYFTSSSTGFIGGNRGAFFRTTDGGTNWTGTTNQLAPLELAFFEIEVSI